MPLETEFEDLPESCIANVISFTTPQDACALSSVSSTFRYAAQSDVVWERFLPSDYRTILSQSSPPLSPSRFPSKKDLYLHLCHNSLLLEAAEMSFVLDKSCGKKCIMLSSNALSFVWEVAPKPWGRMCPRVALRWFYTPGSRFNAVVEMVRMCWLEIRGRMKTGMLSSKTMYEAYLVFKPVDGGAYGFDHQPVEVSVFIVGEEGNDIDRRRKVYLDSANMEDNATTPEPVVHSRPKKRSDGWWEVEMGDFFNKGGEEDKEVDICVLEISRRVSKGGLLLEGIEFRPKPQLS